MSSGGRGGLVAFLGPSLPAAEARALVACSVLAPARQGDVWRALRRRPRAIALVDGVFADAPSVWHRELLDALDAGVAVAGGASMGALRAVELERYGMVAVGRVAGWIRDGSADDEAVALLHAGPDHGWRPFTVPLVNVRAAAERALRRGALRPAEARALLGCAAGVHYQDRTWPRVLEALGRRWGSEARGRWAAFAARGLPDVKAEDARATLRTAARLAE